MNAPLEKWTFSDEPATRKETPLLLGFVGPSGTGKTYSALRVATGIQRVTGGEIFGIDTESERMCHYAPLKGEKADPTRGKFQFRHVPFGAPFDPLKYLAAIEHCVSSGASVVIIDSMSHEHDGVGGVLEQHHSESLRLAEQYKTSIDVVNFSAWGAPKAKRTKLLNTIITDLKIHVLFCFRAKKKISLPTKKQKEAGQRQPIDQGYMPIAGHEFVYELMQKFLFLPGKRGVPVWESEFPGESEMIKIPEQFLHIFDDPTIQLTEVIGQKLAEWAKGGNFEAPSDDDFAQALKRAESADTPAKVKNAAESYRGKPWSSVQRAALKAALDKQRELFSQSQSSAE
jgi:hypothetical protein